MGDETRLTCQRTWPFHDTCPNKKVSIPPVMSKCKICRMATSVGSKKGENLKGCWGEKCRTLGHSMTFPSLRLHLPDV